MWLGTMLCCYGQDKNGATWQCSPIPFRSIWQHAFYSTLHLSNLVVRPSNQKKKHGGSFVFETRSFLLPRHISTGLREWQMQILKAHGTETLSHLQRFNASLKCLFLTQKASQAQEEALWYRFVATISHYLLRLIYFYKCFHNTM